MAKPPGASYPVPLPSEAVPIQRVRHTLGCLGQAAGSTARLAGRSFRGHRAARTPQASLGEYERRWAGVESQERWLATTDLAQATGLSSYGMSQLHALLDFAPFRVPAPAFFRWRARKLAAIVGTHHGACAQIAEIGCGAGKNLLALAAAGYEHLAGYDPTESAIRAVTSQARHFGLSIQAGLFDLLRPDAEGLARLPGQVLLTNHVIEQLPRHVPAAVETLLRAQPLEVVHIEPCPELLRPWRSALDLATWMHTAASDYQRTLLGELARRHECGQITVLEVTPLGYGPMPRSLPTLIRWRPGQP
ncbi:MAG TPA: class I SAM-dependent methyltransferase [Streptosporangiaceae bacterium]|jgi:SAM-dependent methyltransferase|nr:class I SAM-dependent methyltransferase [Streptosporangiaceae bacterium]